LPPTRGIGVRGSRARSNKATTNRATWRNLHAPSGPGVRPDQRLTALARRSGQLEFEPSVNIGHIGVTANREIVTLTGFVSSYAEKTAAERAVRVKGVKAIAEEIEVAAAV
jgi:osmotically-inducible protein OsmY